MREPNPRLARARRRKAELLPQITRLAAEGRSSRGIAQTIGVPKSTIVFLGIGGDKLLYVDAVLDHNVMDQLVRKTDRVLRAETPGNGGNRGGTVSGATGPRVSPQAAAPPAPSTDRSGPSCCRARLRASLSLPVPDGGAR